MNWLALDVGGAHLKVASGQGYAQSYLFHLWRHPGQLTQQIRTAISESPGCDHLLVTMTGELADCFESRTEGVRFILKAVNDGSDNRHTRVYLTDGRLVTPQIAATLPQLAAASNWHALAKFAGRYAQSGAAMLIDIGSTTSDIIPFYGGEPVARGNTDTSRLLSGELVYTGVERSAVCAVARTAPYRGEPCMLVHELFATMRDVYVTLGAMAEDPSCHATADGKPSTKAASRLRLGRMIGADDEDFSHQDAAELAQAVAEEQVKLLAAAVERVRGGLQGPLSTVIVSGHGEFLARTVIQRSPALKNVPVVSLGRELGALVSRCAPAHALAVIGREAAGQ